MRVADTMNIGIFRKTGLVIILAALAAFLVACDSVEDRAKGHFENAERLAAEGENAKARLEYQNALKLDEQLTGAWLGLARHFDNEGDLQAAAGRYLKVLELEPQHAGAAKRMSEIFLLAGNLDEALKYSDIAFDAQPDDAEVIATRAVLHFRKQETAVAVEFAEKAKEIDPLNENAALVLIGARTISGDTDGALGLVDEFLAQSPETLSINLIRLDILNRRGESDAVREQLVKLIGFYPEQTNFRAALAAWYREQGLMEEAVSEFRAIVELDPSEFRRGLALVRFVEREIGREAGAAELERLIAQQSDPDLRFPYERARATVLLARGERDAAFELMNAVLSGDASEETKRDAKIQLATFAMSEDDRDTATGLVNEVLEADAGNIDALALRARMYGSEDRYDEALLDIRAALNAAPENVALLELAANIYRRLGNLSLVGDSYSSALQASNHNPGVALRYARFLQETDNLRAAEIVLAETANRHPANTQVLAALSSVRIRLEDFSGAEDVALQLREIEGGSTLSNRIQAAVSARQDQVDQTIEVLTRSRDEGDTSGANMRALVEAYIRAGKTDEARRFIDGILAEAPDNLFAKALAAAVDLEEGSTDAAIARLEEVIAAAPDNPAGYVSLARLYLRLGETDKWLETYKRAQGAVEDRLLGDLDFLYAQYLEQQQDIDGAIAVYEKLYTTGRNTDVIANNYASLLSDHKADDPVLIEKATVIARRLRGSTVPHFQDTYGWTLYLAGEYQRALQELLPAVEGAPNNPYIQFHIGMTYVKLGLPDRAKPHLEKSLELGGQDLPFMPTARTALAQMNPDESTSDLFTIDTD